MRYWLTPTPDEELWPKVAAINAVYREAPSRAERGERTMSTDELTGVQALERKHPGLPLVPGKVERREFEYVRHGTRSLILSRDVVSGEVVAPSCGPTRTEADLLAHIRGVVATDPTATRWHFVTDNLNTHQSASLVEWVAEVSGLTDDLGVKGESGVLRSQATRAAFVSDPSHRIDRRLVGMAIEARGEVGTTENSTAFATRRSRCPDGTNSSSGSRRN